MNQSRCRSRSCAIVAFLCAATSLFADDSKADWFKPILALKESAEYQIEETYVGEASVSKGHQHVNDFDEHDINFAFVSTPRIKIGVLRLGVEWEHFSFGMPANAPLPNTFQSANLVLGLDTQLSDSILVRVELQPGFYGTNTADADQMNVPVVAGGTYIYSPDLQFIAGVSIDIERDYPVIPAAGIRWKITRQWVLNALLPRPRLEYEATKTLTAYIGGNVKQTNFRMDSDFGSTHHNPRLNNAVLSYSEARAGIGIDWKLNRFFTLSAEAGYQPYRSFDFYRADIDFEEDGSAPYGMISLHGAF